MAIERIQGKEAFENAIGNGSAVVAFGAPWCGYCRRLEPVLAKVADEEADLAFYGINIDNDEDLAARFQIDTVPTVIFFKDGEAKDQFVGFISYAEVKEFLAKNK